MAFTREQIARAIHEMNRTLCVVTGDYSQKPWEQAPPWQRDAAFTMVDDIAEGNALTGRQSHELWCKKKRDGGWVLGAVKDADSDPPTHPDLRPYDELSPVTRAKDDVVRLVAEAMLQS